MSDTANPKLAGQVPEYLARLEWRVRTMAPDATEDLMSGRRRPGSTTEEDYVSHGN